ncbi:MAG: ATP-binding protein [Salibacteraceae bacterium]
MKQPNILKVAISSGVFAVTLMVSIWVWMQYEENIENEQIERIQLLGEHTRSRVWSNINTDIDQLENFANRLEFTDGQFFKFWRDDAEQIVRLDSSIRFLEWIDSNMIIQDVIPLQGNEAILDLDLKDVEYRIDNWQINSKKDVVNITHWTNLIQGGQAFLVDAPVYIDNTFYGTISAGFDFTFDIDQFFEDNSDYHIHLYDHRNQLFFCSDETLCKNIKVDNRFIFNGLININNKEDLWWGIEFYPTESFFDSNKMGSSFSLGLSIFLGLTLSIMLFFIMKTNAQKRSTKAINQRLEKLNVVLAEEKEKAEKSAQVKAEFLSNMSHEIRTPLNIIQGLIQLLSETNDDAAKRKEYLDLLSTSSSNLLGLLNNILDLDRIEAGLLTIQNSRFQPIPKIESICGIFQESYRQKGLELIFESNEPYNHAVIADEVKFTQILSNFLQNALKFTDKGYVKVTYEMEYGNESNVEVTLKIKDTGIGIAPDRLASIFERFSQLDTGYRKKYSGTGLGLAINYELVRLMGGEILVNSEEGVGTEFIVTLRVLDAPAADIPQHDNNYKTSFKGLNCLIVEDNDLNVLVITKMLESLGVQWHSESDGERGVEAFKKGKFDVVFMDLHMPVMDGMEGSAKIMEVDDSVPIVMLSANVTKEAIAQAQDIGIKHYLTKPVSKERIIEVLNEILN